MARSEPTVLDAPPSALGERTRCGACGVALFCSSPASPAAGCVADEGGAPGEVEGTAEWNGAAECFFEPITETPFTTAMATTQASAAASRYRGQPCVKLVPRAVGGGRLETRRRLRAVRERVSQSGTTSTFGCVATWPGADSGGHIGGKYCADGCRSVTVTIRSSQTRESVRERGISSGIEEARAAARSRTRTDATGSAGVFLAARSLRLALERISSAGGALLDALTPMTTGAGVKSTQPGGSLSSSTLACAPRFAVSNSEHARAVCGSASESRLRGEQPSAGVVALQLTFESTLAVDLRLGSIVGRSRFAKSVP